MESEHTRVGGGRDVNEHLDSARDDLAFLRALVSDGGQVQGSVGAGLLAGGLCYGMQSLAQWALLVSGWRAPPLLQLAVGLVPTVVFLAINAAFGGAGVAAMTTAAIFAYLAIRHQSIMIWLFHPMMVCVVQGTVWYIAYAVRRHGWIGLVSAGWFATALLLALLIESHWFVLLLGVSLLVFMALPGWALMRNGLARG
jgi:Na+/H+-dicarboxylate symporter